MGGPEAAGEDVGGGDDLAEAEAGEEQGRNCHAEPGCEGEGGKAERGQRVADENAEAQA